MLMLGRRVIVDVSMLCSCVDVVVLVMCCYVIDVRLAMTRVFIVVAYKYADFIEYFFCKSPGFHGVFTGLHGVFTGFSRRRQRGRCARG